jgi:hypothetical protein
LNAANALDATNSNQSTNAITAGLFAFIPKRYRRYFSIAMARAMDFTVPHRKGCSFPLLADAEEGGQSGYGKAERIAAVIFISNEGLCATSREVRENLANAK